MRPPVLFAALLLIVTVLAPAAVATAEPRTGEDARPAFGDLGSPIRPGASLGGYCTFNFIFYDAFLEEDEQPVAYIGTAGHCTDDLSERVVLASFGEIGTVVYDSDLVDSGVDFSLIEIDADLIGDTNPQMLGWDGPTGYATLADLQRGDIVDLHGYGLVLGQNDLTRDRQGLLVNWTDDEYVIDMPAVNGDSGSPILQDRTGYALGVVSRYGFAAIPPSTDTGPMLPWILRELDAAGLGDVVLATID